MRPPDWLRDAAAHPEIAIGIPAAVVTAKPAYKPKYAELVGYTGPLTLAEAVETGTVSESGARRLVLTWELAVNRQFDWMTKPIVPPPAPEVRKAS
jgi:hypothetical protein